MGGQLVRRGVSLVALLSIGVATGCLASNGDHGDADTAGADGALSAEVCAPKADAEKAKALTDCQAANTFDLNACRKPSEDTLARWQSQVDAVYQAHKEQIDPITSGCKNDVDALSCKDLLASPDHDFSAAADDPRACDAVKKTRKAKCDSDASDAIKAALDGDTVYVQLVDLHFKVELDYLTAIASCLGQGAYKSVAAKTCPAQALAKRASAYLACRHQCPAVSGSACTPDDYHGQDVACGKLTTVSSLFGAFCESGSKCERTSLCDKFDSAKKNADKINSGAGCTTAAGKPGALVVAVTGGSPEAVDAGRAAGAGSVDAVCQDKPASP